MKACPQCRALVDSERDACDRCFAPFAREGEVLFDGRYRIERELGRGGMGIVHLATDLGLGRKVALKVMNPELAAERGQLARFRREAAALASIQNDHVVRVHAFGTTPAPFFVMEYVVGQSLYDLFAGHMARRLWLPMRATLGIVRRVAVGLDAAHEVEVVHRDVKPDNIIVEERTGRPVLIDFGLSGQANATACRSGGGTPRYMAPEQAEWILTSKGPPVTPRADVYALAATTYELLSGRPPFTVKGDDALLQAHVEHEAPLISSLRSDLAAFDPIFVRALAKDARLRYATAGELARALETAAMTLRDDDVRPSATRARAPNPDTLRVLVVDDDDAICRFVTRAAQLAFHRHRVDVTSCRSGEEAIARSTEEMPQLVLLDYSMPGLDGIETLTRIREMRGGADVRVMVVSANVGDEQRVRFGLLGVTDFVKKPVGLRELVSTIANMAERSGWTCADVESVEAS